MKLNLKVLIYCYLELVVGLVFIFIVMLNLMYFFNLMNVYLVFKYLLVGDVFF